MTDKNLLKDVVTKINANLIKLTTDEYRIQGLVIFQIKKDFEKQTLKFIQRIQRIIEKRQMRPYSLDKP